MPNLLRRYQPTGQTWLISMHCSDKTIHFLSVSDGPTSILLDIVITLRKSHEIIFVTYFRKTKNTCERCFWDVSETSQKKDIFLEMLLRGPWDISLNGDLVEISQRQLMPAGYLPSGCVLLLRQNGDVGSVQDFVLLFCVWCE